MTIQRGITFEIDDTFPQHDPLPMQQVTVSVHNGMHSALFSEQLDTISSDTTAILFLLFISLTGFFSEAQRLAALDFEPYMRYSFIGCPLASLIRSMPSLTINYYSIVWIHTLISLVFLAYIPFSKMFHVFVSPVEIALDASEKMD